MRTDARFKFAEFERLCQIIVSTGIQSADTSVKTCIGRQDDDGHLIASAADVLQHVEPGFVRQSEVENHEIILREGERLFRIRRVVHSVDAVVRLLQAFCQPVCEGEIVFDEQNSHE